MIFRRCVLFWGFGFPAFKWKIILGHSRDICYAVILIVFLLLKHILSQTNVVFKMFPRFVTYCTWKMLVVYINVSRTTSSEYLCYPSLRLLPCCMHSPIIDEHWSFSLALASECSNISISPVCSDLFSCKVEVCKDVFPNILFFKFQEVKRHPLKRGCRVTIN